MTIDNFLAFLVGLVGGLLLIMILYYIVESFRKPIVVDKGPYQGETRFNTLNFSIEIWDGEQWREVITDGEPFGQNVFRLKIPLPQRQFPHDHWKNPIRLNEGNILMAWVDGELYCKVNDDWVVFKTDPVKNMNDLP